MVETSYSWHGVLVAVYDASTAAGWVDGSAGVLRIRLLAPVDMSERSDHAHMIAAAESTEPIDSTDTAEPMEPIDSTEPTEPIDRREPLLQMQSVESWDLIDHVDPSSRVIASSWRNPARKSGADGVRGSSMTLPR